jgi:glycerol-3-phosphate cytidylyltransferase
MKVNIGFTCSAFDLIHPGHILMLKEAREKVCNWLVVGLQIDPSIDREWKNKPIQTLEERLIVLQAIKYVDEIHVYQTEKDLLDLIKEINPDVRILGSDYENRPELIIGKEFGSIFYHNRNHNWSTTELRFRIKEM